VSPPLAVAFAARSLTSRASRATVLRVALTGAAVVQVRVTHGTRTVLTRRFTFRTGGRKQLPLGRLRAATYAVALTATDGGGQAVDRAALRVLRGS
jgi:hypothetical protein